MNEAGLRNSMENSRLRKTGPIRRLEVQALCGNYLIVSRVLFKVSFKHAPDTLSRAATKLPQARLLF
jgi:hypothetical protein